MAPASRDAPDVPNEDARDDCRTKQSSPEGGEGSVEEDTRACDAETTPDDATDMKPDEDDNSRQVRGSARASRHDPFPEASRARLLLSFRDSQCRFFPARCVSPRARARGASRRRASGNAAAPRVHGRARADPERPPPAFPAFRVDVRPLDAGSSKTPELPEAFSRRFSLIRALDWPARDRGEDIFTAIFFSIFTASVGEDEIARPRVARVWLARGSTISTIDLFVFFSVFPFRPFSFGALRADRTTAPASGSRLSRARLQRRALEPRSEAIASRRIRRDVRAWREPVSTARSRCGATSSSSPRPPSSSTRHEADSRATRGKRLATFAETEQARCCWRRRRRELRLS
jgi:hypothetical protein